MSRIRSGFTYQALFTDPKLEAYEFLCVLQTTVESLLQEMYKSDPIVVIGSSWADMEEEYKDCENVVNAIQFLQNNGFSHSALSDAFNKSYLTAMIGTENMALHCLQVRSFAKDIATWSIEWDESTADHASFTVDMVQEMLRVTRLKYPDFQGQIVYGSIDAPGDGAENPNTYVCVSSVSSLGVFEIRCIDVQTAGRLSAREFVVQKNLLLELYDDDLNAFKIEFEHWSLAFGAVSHVSYADSEPLVSIKIKPTDFATALMLSKSSSDLLMSKFLSWVQNWRMLDQYGSSILDHDFVGSDGKPSAQVRELVPF